MHRHPASAVDNSNWYYLVGHLIQGALVTSTASCSQQLRLPVQVMGKGIVIVAIMMVVVIEEFSISLLLGNSVCYCWNHCCDS